MGLSGPIIHFGTKYDSLPFVAQLFRTKPFNQKLGRHVLINPCFVTVFHNSTYSFQQFFWHVMPHMIKHACREGLEPVLVVRGGSAYGLSLVQSHKQKAEKQHQHIPCTATRPPAWLLCKSENHPKRDAVHQLPSYSEPFVPTCVAAICL